MPSNKREENYEHVLMCLICRSLFDDHDHQPKFLPCHHTFCKDCLREYVRQMGDEIECPSCRKVATIPAAGVAALQTNFYVKYIQSLVYGGGGPQGAAKECPIHSDQTMQLFCQECRVSVCQTCCDPNQQPSLHTGHNIVLLAAKTDEMTRKLSTAFTKASTSIEQKKVKLEAFMKSLSEEKDQALLKIDSSFDQMIHLLNRRSTLLKNKVIALYNDNVQKLDSDLEEISTAMTCIVSLKDYHENLLSCGMFVEVEKGPGEIEEVQSNIEERVKPTECHIVFEEKHGTDKFRTSAKDLGRVTFSNPGTQRTEPEGMDRNPNDSSTQANVPSTPNTPDTSPSEADPYCQQGLVETSSLSNGETTPLEEQVCTVNNGCMVAAPVNTNQCQDTNGCPTPDQPPAAPSTAASSVMDNSSLSNKSDLSSSKMDTVCVETEKPEKDPSVTNNNTIKDTKLVLRTELKVQPQLQLCVSKDKKDISMKELKLKATGLVDQLVLKPRDKDEAEGEPKKEKPQIWPSVSPDTDPLDTTHMSNVDDITFIDDTPSSEVGGFIEDYPEALGASCSDSDHSSCSGHASSNCDDTDHMQDGSSDF